MYEIMAIKISSLSYSYYPCPFLSSTGTRSEKYTMCIGEAMNTWMIFSSSSFFFVREPPTAFLRLPIPARESLELGRNLKLTEKLKPVTISSWRRMWKGPLSSIVRAYPTISFSEHLSSTIEACRRRFWQRLEKIALLYYTYTLHSGFAPLGLASYGKGDSLLLPLYTQHPGLGEKTSI